MKYVSGTHVTRNAKHTRTRNKKTTARAPSSWKYESAQKGSWAVRFLCQVGARAFLQNSTFETHYLISARQASLNGLWGNSLSWTNFVCVSMTSPCLFNRSATLLYNWQNGRQIIEMIYFVDHGPSAHLVTPMVLRQLLHSTVLALDNN